MSKNVKYSRLILKATSIVGSGATIPTSPYDDHTITPAWKETDIYKGELYVNLQDDKLFIRTNNGIRDIILSQLGTVALGDVIYYNGSEWINTPISYITNIYSGATSGGTSGTNGTSGSSGTNGTSGSSGINGTSGSSGTNGTSGSSGTSGSGSGTTTLSALTDVDFSVLLSGQTLIYSGGTWINGDIIENLEWNKWDQNLTIHTTSGDHILAIEGRPIDYFEVSGVTTGYTLDKGSNYTALCGSGVTLFLPSISGTGDLDSVYGTIFKIKLIQSGSSFVEVGDINDKIFKDDFSTTNILTISNGITVTLQSDGIDTWYII